MTIRISLDVDVQVPMHWHSHNPPWNGQPDTMAPDLTHQVMCAVPAGDGRVRI